MRRLEKRKNNYGKASYDNMDESTLWKSLIEDAILTANFQESACLHLIEESVVSVGDVE